ncbi:MAG: aspartate-semialdehyde dehydrogenase [Chloroflexota bacterium]|nr:aspartate-semialdehyde dehydrogenase [Chloroflexota bacterium]
MASKNDKIKVAVLGATGMVGQRFIQLLENHPWFEVAALAGSSRSAGKLYKDACRWYLEGDMPAAVAGMQVLPAEPPMEVGLVFSALPADVAVDIESEFAQAGYTVCSNSSAHRYDADVPILIPEINAGHLDLLALQKEQRGWPGRIITSPNCTTTAAVFPLKALDDLYGVEQVILVSMQAVSGAGYPGLPYLSIIDNVIPLIGGEEKKLELEPRLLLGKLQDGQRVSAPMVISAQANRVAVSDGHTVCLSVKLVRPAQAEDVKQALRDYAWPEEIKDLPSAPAQPMIVRDEDDRPQPRLDRGAENGMAVSIGRVRPCPILDLRLVTVVHNTLRGAASGSILNAELLKARGYLD